MVSIRWPWNRSPGSGRRKTLLTTFFALGSLISYVRYAQRQIGCFTGVRSGLFIFALLSKPTTTPLPILLLLLDYWPLRRLNGKAVVEKIPFLLVGVVSAIVTMISQARTAWVQMPHDNPLLIALIIGHDLVFHLGKILWPVNLSSHYPYPLPFAWSNSVPGG